MERRVRILLISFFCSLCLWSCKSVMVGGYDEKENIRPVKLVETVVSKNPNYKMASYKFSAECSVNGGSPDTFSGILRVCRDSLIWLSLRSFNIEGFRVLVTTDSVKVMNRIQNQYYAEDISSLEKLIRVDLSYYELQSILLNEFFYYPMPDDTARAPFDYKSCVDSIYYCVSTISQKKQNRVADRMDRPNYSIRNGTSMQTVKIVPGTFKVKSMYLEDIETNRNAFVEYDSFVKSGDVLFPQKLSLDAESNGFYGSMKFSISDFEVESELTFPFKVPVKYAKVSLNEKNK